MNCHDAAAPQRAFAIVIGELRRRVFLIAAVVALMIAGTAVGLVSPLLFKTLIDRAIPARNGGMVAWLLAGMAALPLLAAGLSALQHYLRGHIGEAVSRSLRQALFEHLLHARLLPMERVRTGDIVYRITSSCGELGRVYVTSRLLPLLSNAIVLTGNVTAMFLLNGRLLLLALLAFPPSFLFTTRLARHAKALDTQFKSILEGSGSYLHEVFGGLRTVRALGAEAHEKRRWGDWLQEHWKIVVKTSVFHNVVRTLPSEVINHVVLGIVFGYGAFEVIRGRLSIGGLVAFIAYVPTAYAALRALLDAQVSTAQARVAAENIDALFAIGQERPGGRVLPVSPASGAAIEFRDVSFDYGRGDFGVQNLSFRAEPGEFLGIVGASGGGKTTILDLLMGFYTPQSGAISVDGIDIEELSPASLRSQIGFVSQDIFLWNASIRENIAYPGKEVDVRSVREAARIAHLHEFVEALPEGYETLVGERGLGLSGGERQRLAIARAIIRRPRILLLDEPTSALDALTERKIRDAIESAKHGRTTIVVAHRLATVIHADRILVLEKGRIVEMGTPQELLTNRSRFHALYHAQKM